MEEEEEEEEEDVEYREVDPMAVIEEKIILLESMTQGNPYNDQLDAKHEEYIGLMEELEILGKKMRKTDRLLDQDQHNDTIRTKLQRKRDQYEQEVTDIVLYAEQDPFFDLDGQHAENLLMAGMNAHSLLGQPLETLTEMSGFEDSIAWNDSSSRLDYGSSTSSFANGRSPRTPRTPRKLQRRIEPSLRQDLTVTKDDHVSILKQKLKQAKSMFENSIDDRERRMLLKKVTEYRDKLELIQGFKQQDSDNDLLGSNRTDQSPSSEASIDVPKQTAMQALVKAHGGGTQGVKVRSKASTQEENEEYLLLKKKLAKATKLAQTSSDSKNIKKLQSKIQEYVVQLQLYPSWEKDQVSMGYGSNASFGQEDADNDVQSASDDDDGEVQGEEHRRFARDEQQEQQVRRSVARSMMESHKQHEYDKQEQATEQPKMLQDSLNLEKYVQEERTTVKILRKKLKKVEQMMDDMLRSKGDEARYNTDFRKLQKKRTQYIAELGDDSASLSSLSLGPNATNGRATLENSTLTTPSSSSKRLGSPSVVASPTIGSPQPSVSESNMGSPTMNPDDDSATELLKKKLKKVEKLMTTTGTSTKEYSKLARKKIQYQQELVELKRT